MPTVSNHSDNTDRLSTYLQWFRVVRGRAPSSVQSYQWTLDAYMRHLGSTSVCSASAEQVESFLMRPRPPHGLVGRPGTRRHDLAVVSSFYAWLCATDPASHNPTRLVGVPPVSQRKPKALDDDVWRRVWSHALPVERAWLGLGFFAGLRAVELVRVKGFHFHADDSQIIGFERKGGDEGQVMCGQMARIFHTKLPVLLPNPEDWLGPMRELAAARDPGQTLVPWLERTSNRGNGWSAEGHAAGISKRYGLLDGDVAPDVPGRRLVRVLKRAGLHPNLFTPHALRHSFVANCLRPEVGLPIHIVQRLASHSTPAVTMRYGRATESMLGEWLGNNS